MLPAESLPPDPLLALPALALAVAAGLVAHEWAHALALRLARVEYVVEYFPGPSDGRSRGTLAALTRGPWAVVRPQPTGDEPPWKLRVAALMPLTLTGPVLALGAVGLLSESAGPVVAAAAIGWLACAIPSPQDFSVAFYAHAALENGSSRHANDPDASSNTRDGVTDRSPSTPASRAD